MKNKMIELLSNVTFGVNNHTLKDHLCASTIEEFVDALIANGVTLGTDNNVPTKWIPVSERLPDLGEKVVARCRYFDEYRVVWLQQDERLDHPYWSYDGDHGYHVKFFEYWMPLPEPPKENE